MGDGAALVLFMNYHAVIIHFTFFVNTKNNGLHYPDPPNKSTVPFGAKNTRADSTLETALPPLFPDPVSRSRSDCYLYYLRMC